MSNDSSSLLSTKNILWVEKYRPKHVDDMVISPTLRKKVLWWFENPQTNLPNLILVGPPGSGKTTLATIIVHALIRDNSDYLYINGSADRGIQTMKDSVLEFMRFEPTGLSPIKILFIDEADNLTPDAFKALRSSMEQYQAHVRIVMTGNYDTFPEAIQSRCTVLRFESMPMDETINRLKNILDLELVTYEEEDIKTLVSKFYPDLRKCINYAQVISSQYGSLDLSVLEEVLDDRDMFTTTFWSLVDPSHNITNTMVWDYRLKVLEYMKKLNINTQTCLNLIQDLSKKLDGIITQSIECRNNSLNTRVLNYYLAVKTLLSNTSTAIRQCPLPEGCIIELMFKVQVLRNLLV